jgi:uncharacterized RDD family membrane protein YckC
LPLTGSDVAARAHVAGLGRRIGAMVYDAMIVLAIWIATLFVLVTLTNHAVMGAPVQSLAFVETFAFFAWFWIRRGQTIGMLAWGLRVETADGRPFRLAHAFLRFVGALLSFTVLGLGYLWMLIDPDRRTWSDMLSGTQVIHVKNAV